MQATDTRREKPATIRATLEVARFYLEPDIGAELFVLEPHADAADGAVAGGRAADGRRTA